MIVKPSINFLTKFSGQKLAQAVATILAAMGGNLIYPLPFPTLLAISALLAAFIQAQADAANGGKGLTAIRNAKRAELVAGMRLLAVYVTGACGNNLANLIGSGFPIQKPNRTKIGMLAAPVTPVVKQGNHSGMLQAATVPMAGGSSYMWQIALASAPNAVLQMHVSTASKFTFQNLTPGQIYVVIAAVLGTAGLSEWSNAGKLMVI